MADIDYSKPTIRYEQPVTPKLVSGQADESIDYSASTGLYPMAPFTGLKVVEAIPGEDGKPLDFARSAGRYPMRDYPAKRQPKGAKDGSQVR